MIPGARKYRPTGAYLFFLICIGIGATAATPDSTSPSEDRVRQCAPVERHAGTDEEGWNVLIDQGYTEQGGALVPPGCESVTR